MTHEEMIKLTETNNEMIEKLSLQNKWIVQQYMKTFKTKEKLKNQVLQIMDEYHFGSDDESIILSQPKTFKEKIFNVVDKYVT